MKSVNIFGGSLQMGRQLKDGLQPSNIGPILRCFEDMVV